MSARGGEYLGGFSHLPLDEVVPPGSALASYGRRLFGGRVAETDDQLGTHSSGRLRIVARAMRLKEVTGPAPSPILCAASSRSPPRCPRRCKARGWPARSRSCAPGPNRRIRRSRPSGAEASQVRPSAPHAGAKAGLRRRIGEVAGSRHEERSEHCRVGLGVDRAPPGHRSGPAPRGGCGSRGGRRRSR